MPQLSISSDPQPGYEGAYAYGIRGDKFTETKVVADGQTIGFGLAVVRAANQTARLPAAGAEITGGILGISVRQAWREDNGAQLGYAAGSVMPVMKHGYIWVRVEGAVTEGAGAFARFAAGAGGTQLGAFRADADTATAAAVPNARFHTSTTGAGLAVLEVW